MKNELQQVLDDILDDKTTNLKPENLRQEISCLGIEGALNVPQFNYSLSNTYIENNYNEDSDSFVQHSNDWGPISPVYIVDDEGNFIGAISTTSTGSYKTPRIYTYNKSSKTFDSGVNLTVSTVDTDYDVNTVTDLSINASRWLGDRCYVFLMTSGEIFYTLKIIRGSNGKLTLDKSEWWKYTPPTSMFGKTGIYDQNTSPAFSNIDYHKILYVVNYGGGFADQNQRVLVSIKLTDTVNELGYKEMTVNYTAITNYDPFMPVLVSNDRVCVLAQGYSGSVTKKSQIVVFNDNFEPVKCTEYYSRILAINNDATKLIADAKVYNVTIDYSSGDVSLSEITTLSFFNRLDNVVQSYDCSKYFTMSEGTSAKMYAYNIDWNSNTLTQLYEFSISSSNRARICGRINNNSGIIMVFSKSNKYNYQSVIFTPVIQSLNYNSTEYYNTFDASIESGDIIEGKIAYGEDGKITGTMTNNGDVTITPTTSEQIKEQGYYNSLKINPVTSDIDENIKPENIKKDVSILGVTGSLEASGGSDVTPIYQTTEYTIKDISVDLNEVVNSVSTYGDYVVVHTTLNKLKVYNKSDLSTPLITQDNVELHYQGFVYIYDFNDNKLYITAGSEFADGVCYIADLTEQTITSITYENILVSTQDNDVHIDRLNHLVHYRHGSYKRYLCIYSYDAIQGFTQLADVYNNFGSYLGDNVYENSKNIVIINNNGSYSDYNIVPSSMNYDVSGLNYTKTKAFVYSYDDYKSVYVYSLNDDYSLNELLDTIELSFEFTNGRPIFECLNSNYYYLSYNENNYILKFDEDTNQFSIILTNQSLKLRNSLPYIENQNQYINFQQGDTEIGILYNGNQYLTRDKYTGYTNSTLLTGNTMYDIAHQIVAGTMSNNGDVIITPTTQEQTKEQGYYNSLKVSAVTSDIDSNIVPENIKKDISILGVTGTLEETTGTDTSDATAVASDIAINKTAYVNGEKVTGTLPIESNVFAKKAYNSQDEKQYNQIRFFANNDVKTIVDKNIMVQVYTDYAELAETLELTPNKLVKGNAILEVVGTAIELKGQTKTVTPTTNLQTIIPDENYNGLTSVEVSAVTSDIDENIKAENIKLGVEILGVTGTLESGTGVDTSDATATADDIVSPKTAYVNGEKVEGTIKLIDVQDPNSYYGIGDEPTVFMDDNSITFYDRIPVRHCYEQNSFVGVGMSFGEFNNQVGITPDKIVEGNTILGIVGTGGAGTEYEPLSRLSTAVTDVQLLENNFVSLSGVVSDTGIVTENETTFVAGTSFENLANTIGLTADKIKKGETILGITGTYEGTTTTEE